MLKDSSGLTVPLIRLIIEHGSAIIDSVGFWGYLLVRQKKKNPSTCKYTDTQAKVYWGWALIETPILSPGCPGSEASGDGGSPGTALGPSHMRKRLHGLSDGSVESQVTVLSSPAQKSTDQPKGAT